MGEENQDSPPGESPEVVEAKEREELQNFISDLGAKIASKTQLREENLKCVRPDEDYFTRLDSNLKKNTAFVKKLKQFTGKSCECLDSEENEMMKLLFLKQNCRRAFRILVLGCLLDYPQLLINSTILVFLKGKVNFEFYCK